MNRILPLILSLLLLAALPAEAQRRSSLRPRLKPSAVGQEQKAAFDSVPAQGSVRFSGYEKTLRSTRETVFVTNLSDREIEGVIFTIRYNDSSGRQLHEARRTVHAGIPAGETRRIDFPSWDRQMTFYYAGSPRPRVSAIPYTVEIHPDTLLIFP